MKCIADIAEGAAGHGRGRPPWYKACLCRVRVLGRPAAWLRIHRRCYGGIYFAKMPDSVHFSIDLRTRFTQFTPSQVTAKLHMPPTLTHGEIGHTKHSYAFTKYFAFIFRTPELLQLDQHSKSLAELSLSCSELNQIRHSQ